MTATKKKSPSRGRKPAPPDERIVKAMSHPIRFQALSILTERVASPSDIAEELGETVGAVAYHVRVLRELEAIELVKTVQRRGATESYYRATVRPWFSDEEYAKLPARTRRQLFVPTVRRIVDDAMAAITAGGFDDQRAHASWTALDLDAEGWDAAVQVLTETVERLIEIQGEAATRAVETGTDERVRTEVAVMHFEPVPAPERRRRAGSRS